MLRRAAAERSMSLTCRPRRRPRRTIRATNTIGRTATGRLLPLARFFHCEDFFHWGDFVTKGTLVYRKIFTTEQIFATEKISTKEIFSLIRFFPLTTRFLSTRRFLPLGRFLPLSRLVTWQIFICQFHMLHNAARQVFVNLTLTFRRLRQFSTLALFVNIVGGFCVSIDFSTGNFFHLRNSLWFGHKFHDLPGIYPWVFV